MPKTSIRQPALAWFQEKYPAITEPVIASKFFPPTESWNKLRVWFFQVPLSVVEPNKIRYIHMVCQNNLKGDPFLYFKVPTLFLLRNEKLFEVDRTKKVMRLYLSAEAVDMYKEVRKGSNLNFSGFLQASQVDVQTSEVEIN